MSYCIYYQAHVRRESAWFLTAILRSFDHLAFDRTFDVQSSTFEFFVPPLMQKHFLSVMDLFEQEGYISDLKELPNRLRDAEVV